MKNKKASNKTYQMHGVPCVVCGTFYEQITAHHIKSRGSGGNDEPWNLLPVCASCHERVHKVGLVHLSLSSKPLASWLADQGWELNDFLGKWIRPCEDHKPEQ